MRSFLYKALFLVALVALPYSALADTLYISPSSGSYPPGKTFSVRVFVSSTAQAINAVSGVLSFPTDKLQVISVSKADSILTLWVQDPSFSNAQGTISFEGVVPNPGFIGSTGRIITVNFKTVGQGDAIIKFSSGAVLANDGNGTNILKNVGSATFSIGSSPVPAFSDAESAPAGPSRDPRTPDAPVVTSSTFADSGQWYTANSGVFEWKVGDNITATRLLLGKLPSAEPTVSYDPPISTKTLEDIGNGVWYLHVQLKNKYGWGATTHYQFKIDTSKPDSFAIREMARADTTDPRARFSFSATDGVSGIDHYDIQIDGGDVIDWRDGGAGIFAADPLGPGKHSIVSRVYDEAGNYAVASVDFRIDPIASPRIDKYTEEVTGDTPLSVSGGALPNTKVHVLIAKGDNEPIEVITKSDPGGSFSALFSADIPKGTYRLWAVTEDKRGAQSEPSAEKSIVVKGAWLISFGTSAMSVLAIAIPIFALVFVLVFVVLYGTHKIRVMRRGVRKELHEVESLMDKAFMLLKEDVEDSIRLLERAKNKRKLTQEEDAIIERFRQNLSDAEKLIKKEIHDVERKIGDR
ncbi:MAG: hypothetical protein WC767_00355 [Candidatus Paceibacterota bacterium]|jgi:hypothetical protein